MSTPEGRGISLTLIGRLGWVLLGGMIVLIGALSLWPEPIYYPEVIVPAPRILVREVPSGPPTIRERIVYVYLQPDVRAIAPGAVVEDVVRFCRPVVLAIADTLRVPSPSLIRTGTVTPSIIPLRKAHLFLSSMDGYGTLVGEDYGVRLPLGFAAGLEPPFHTVVRYSRLAPFREIARGFAWWGTIEGSFWLGRKILGVVR